jgi:hypothetical protein
MRLQLIGPTAAVLTMLCGAQAFAGPVVVRCAPGEHAIVRDSVARGEAVTRVQCVGATYRATTYREPYGSYRVRRHRSWGKSALIISGSAATGAGVGGLIAGKKGALLGAAFGGGAASLYEGAHRR